MHHRSIGPWSMKVFEICKNATDLTAEILAKAGEALLVEAQQREDLEKPLHLREVDRRYSFIKLLSNDDLQLLLCLLQHYQTGIHGTACAHTMHWQMHYSDKITVQAFTYIASFLHLIYIHSSKKYSCKKFIVW